MSVEDSGMTLILGGARSGKSSRAMHLAASSGMPVVYVATARDNLADQEWHARIARHRRERPAGWVTIEEPLDVAGVLQRLEHEVLVLVDCLTLWLSNLLLENRSIEHETERLLAALAKFSGPSILVSNETGWGIVPDHALGRAFRDAQGRLNQQLAAHARRVELIVAGIPVCIKPDGAS